MNINKKISLVVNIIFLCLFLYGFYMYIQAGNMDWTPGLVAKEKAKDILFWTLGGYVIIQGIRLEVFIFKKR